MSWAAPVTMPTIEVGFLTLARRDLRRTGFALDLTADLRFFAARLAGLRAFFRALAMSASRRVQTPPLTRTVLRPSAGQRQRAALGRRRRDRHVGEDLVLLRARLGL